MDNNMINYGFQKIFEENSSQWGFEVLDIENVVKNSDQKLIYNELKALFNSGQLYKNGMIDTDHQYLFYILRSSCKAKTAVNNSGKAKSIKLTKYDIRKFTNMFYYDSMVYYFHIKKYNRYILGCFSCDSYNNIGNESMLEIDSNSKIIKLDFYNTLKELDRIRKIKSICK